MKYFLLILVLAVMTPAQAAVNLIELRIPASFYIAQKEENAAEGGGSIGIMLPRFAAFGPQGRLYYFQEGLPDDFSLRLAAVVKSPDGSKATLSLAEVFSNAVTQAGSPMKGFDAEVYDFIFVEYWADWCAPCNEQKAKVKAFLAKHPDLDIAWLYIEADPTKVDLTE